MKIVLQKFIADSGLCSRRKAEELIKLCKVLVNGELAELGMKVDKNDEVKVNNNIIGLAKEKIYIKLNKPAGYVCTNAEFKGERSVFELVSSEERLFVVGRLDKDSRGLVILTNDGDWANKMMHPRYEHEKIYRVRIFGIKQILSNDLIIARLKRGVDIGDGDGIVKVKNIKEININTFEIILAEGKKRQIRRMFKALGCEVEDLVRTRIGKIELGNLGEGKWEKISSQLINK